MTREQVRTVILIPALAWVALCVALALTVAYAYLPHAPIKPVAGLAISAIKALIIVIVFMRLDRSSNLVRLTSAVGLTWLSLLFILAFTDYLTRS